VKFKAVCLRTFHNIQIAQGDSARRIAGTIASARRVDTLAIDQQLPDRAAFRNRVDVFPQRR
jgi:hypothetical protein